MNKKPEENIACCGCANLFHDGPCAEQGRPGSIKQMPSKESICEAAVSLCNRIPGCTAWNAAEFAYDEMVSRLTNVRPLSDCSHIKRLAQTGADIPGCFSDDLLELIAEKERFQSTINDMTGMRQAHGFDSWAAVLVEVSRLKDENVVLRNTANQQPTPEKCEHGIRINQSCFDCMSKLHGAKS